MPAKKGTKGKGRKRATPPRRRQRTTKVVVTKLGLPDKMLVRLPYTDLTAIIGTSGSFLAQKSYNINSLYDPETNSLNQQNLYFAEYMRIYNSYRVYKVDYKVTLYNTANNSACAGSLSFDPQGQQMSIVDIAQLSKPYSKRFTLAPAGNTGSQKTISGSIYLPAVMGLTSEQYRTVNGADAGFVGGGNFNPAQIIQMSINLFNVNQGAVCSVQADVRYVCHSELFGRDTAMVVGTDAPIEEVLR